MFFFPIETSHLLYRFFKPIDKKKDKKYNNDVDVNNALCCPTPTTVRPKNITAVVAATMTMNGLSPVSFLTSPTVAQVF